MNILTAMVKKRKRESSRLLDAARNLGIATKSEMYRKLRQGRSEDFISAEARTTDKVYWNEIASSIQTPTDIVARVGRLIEYFGRIQNYVRTLGFELATKTDLEQFPEARVVVEQIDNNLYSGTFLTPHPLKVGITGIGRSKRNSNADTDDFINLGPNKHISRTHATILFLTKDEVANFYIINNSSKYSLTVNSEINENSTVLTRYSEPLLLNSRDNIYIADTHLVFYTDLVFGAQTE